MKEIYNYDFISINKEDYNLDNEKQKLKVLDLTKKLLIINMKLYHFFYWNYSKLEDMENLK